MTNTPRNRRRRALAALLVGATAVLGIPAASVSATSSAPAAAAPAAAPSAGRISSIPSTCHANVSIVRPDRSLAVGVVRGTKAEVVPSGVTLAYMPRVIAYVGTSASKGLTIDRYFAIDNAGALHRIAVYERPANTPRVTFTDTVLGRGWGGIRTMVASGPYLYGITTTGALQRYSVRSDYTVRGAGTLARSGWQGVRSLAFGGWWNTGGNRRAEDIVGLAYNGSVAAYMVPRTAPLTISTHRLVTGGWGMFSQLSAGLCTTSTARTILGVKPDGDVHVYYDVNGNDQSWRDLRVGPRVATGWTGVIGA